MNAGMSMKIFGNEGKRKEELGKRKEERG